MLQIRLFIARTCLFAVAFLTAGLAVYADDKKSAIPEGYKEVTLQSGATVLVKKEKDPLEHVSTPGKPGKYDPSQLFNGSNPMAQKKFSFGPDVPENNSSFMDHAQDNYLTKPYFSQNQPQAADHTVPNLNNKVTFPTSSAYSQKAAGFNQNYSTSASEMGRSDQPKIDVTTSSDQGRTAVLGDSKTSTYASILDSKASPDAFAKDNNKPAEGLIALKDLPNRPLTIDEVRALINHGVKPNMDEKPEPATKALNDPDYKPEVSPAPPPSTEDDKSDAVPSPGTMAQPPPENSEPLPQH